MDLTENAELILKKHYLAKDKNGKIIETPAQMFKRVAKAISANDDKYEEEFFRLMSEGTFLPNSPTLMNAGCELGQLSACFVLPIEDSIKDIFKTLGNMALIHQSGGGTGFNFSKLRKKGSAVKTTHGIASGPVSFMEIFDCATNVIRQGGRRRGANMGILNIDHPDILEFISAKKDPNRLSNFNLSVAVTDKFMESVKKDLKYTLKDPVNGRIIESLPSKDVFSKIIGAAWETGDPGIIFIDQINRENPLKRIGIIDATNPCGEQPLFANESCNLGSINLSKFVNKTTIDFEQLKTVVQTAVRFLDNAIDINKYPLEEISIATKANRKIGLGVMGFADLLIKLGIPYNSEKAILTAEKIMPFIQRESHRASEELGKLKGSFANFDKSRYKNKVKFMRNAAVTTIAPTGTISIIANCTSGIEPIFGIAYIRALADGHEMVEYNELFEKAAKKERFWVSDLLKKILNEGGIKEFPQIPQDVKNLFLCACEIPAEQHIKIAAAFQKYTDNAVSKTVNLPNSATKEDIQHIFFLAYKLKCKGITVFRSGSKKEQVLSIKSEDTNRLVVESEYSGGCPVDYCTV